MPETTQTKRDMTRRAERAVEGAFASGKVDRAAITRLAVDESAEAADRLKVALAADEEADEALRLCLITEGMGDAAKTKRARTMERQAHEAAKKAHAEATHCAREAYDAVRFSDPTKLGFMRAIEVVFGLHIVLTIATLVFTSRDDVVYDSVNITDWLMVVAEGVAFWFFINRYKIARPFVIGMALLAMASSLVSQIVTNTFSPFVWAASSTFYLVLILYFTFSRRVKMTLVNDLSREQGDMEKGDFIVENTGWPHVRNLIIYFVVFSVLGHWMEASMCQLIRLGLVQGSYDPTNTMLWRDWLYPYPMHGIAVVLIAVVLYPLYKFLLRRFGGKWYAYLLSFVANALMCAMVELIGGLMFNADHQFWDYSDDFMNFMGQIDLQNTLAFGAAASIITWFVYPRLERLIARVRPAIMNIVFVVVVGVGAILFSLYLISPPVPAQAEEEALRAKDASALALISEAADATANNVLDLGAAAGSAPILTDDQKADISRHTSQAASELRQVSTIVDEAQQTAKQPTPQEAPSDGSAEGTPEEPVPTTDGQGEATEPTDRP